MILGLNRLLGGIRGAWSRATGRGVLHLQSLAPRL